MDERRKHVRKMAGDTFIVCDTRTDKVIGLVVNLTIEGAKLVSREKVEVPKIFQCRMALPDRIMGRSQVNFEAESRWCEWSEKTGMFETGFEFHNLPAADQKLIETLLQTWPIPQPESLEA